MKLAEAARSLRTHRLAREGSWIALGQLGSLVARLIGLRLITSLVSPDVYAEVALLLGLATLGANLFCQPLAAALLRFYPEAVASDRVGTLRALIGGLLARRALLVGGVVLGGGTLWAFATGRPGTSVGFLLITLLLGVDVTRIFESDQLNASRRQALFSAWTVANDWLRPGLAVAAILVLGPSSASILLGYVVAVALGNALFWRVRERGRGGPPAPDDAWAERMRGAVSRFALPLVPQALVVWIMTLSDRYLLAWLANTTETGIYAAAYGIASMPFIVLSAVFGLALRPLYYEAAARNDLPRERRIFALWGLLLIPPAFGGLALITVLAEPITRLLVGEAFWEAAELLPWIALAYAIQAGQHLFETALFAQRRTRSLLVVHTTAAVTGVVAYLVLIPKWGAFGAAVGTILGMSASFVMAVALSNAIPRLVLGRVR